MINDQQDKMEIPFEIHILTDSSFLILKHNSYTRGYHTYMDIWKSLTRDGSLRCKREDDTIDDKNAVAIIHFNHTRPRLVGHVPFLYSSTLKKFLSLPNHTIRVLVTEKRINCSAGYGLEIPVEYVYNSNEKAPQWAKKNLDDIDASINKKVGRCLKWKFECVISDVWFLFCFSATGR